jgi:phosphoribosylformimino-5-aminoimidazole carboxamide ribotide isomerase
MLIIPALYIENGKAVTLYKGHDNAQKKTYSRSPLNIAKDFASRGAGLIQLIDLDGSRAGAPQNLKLIQKIATETGTKIEVGGGIRTLEDIDALMQRGISRVILGVTARNIIPAALEKYGPDRIVFGIKAKRNMIVDSDSLSENSDQVIDIAKSVAELGVKHIVYKDLEKQGTLYHPNYDDVDRLIIALPDVYIYSSGGIASMEDFNILSGIGAAGVVACRAFVEYKINLREVLRNYQSTA